MKKNKIGIIAEYNPFHNGHLLQINWIKEHFPNDEIIVILTDVFTQRGDLNLLTFEQRKEILKKYGINEIIKMSFEESVQAAHIYAKNAILKLNDYQINKLVFGSETADVTNMLKNAKILKEKGQEFFQEVKKVMKKEKTSYPKAMNLVYSNWNLKRFDSPNDILAYEYIKVIVNFVLNIEPIAIKREVNYFDLEPKGNIASATYLRTLIKNGDDISLYSPIKNKIKYRDLSVYFQDFKQILKSIELEKIKTIPLISEGIENLLLKNLDALTFEDFIERCTSKRYTSTRIKRIIAWVIYKFKLMNWK